MTIILNQSIPVNSLNSNAPEVVISPPGRWQHIDLREIWSYRELLIFFSWKDFKVRYKQTVVGALWALIQPFFSMIVFTIFFGKFAQIPSEGVPYSIFVFVGLLFWQLFSSNVTDVSNSLISNQSIVTKVYFPRLLLPFSYFLTNFVDFSLGWVMLVLLFVYFKFTPNLTGLLVYPLLIAIIFMTSSGIGLFLASINSKYRDVRYVLPYFIQLLMFVSPVIYPPSLLGDMAWILALNPLSAVITTARSSLLGTAPVSVQSIVVSLVIATVLFSIGTAFFKRSEAYFADIV